MEFNLKLDDKYLVKPRLSFFYEERRGNNDSNFCNDYRDNYHMIQITKIDIIDEFFAKIHFLPVQDTSAGYYTQHSHPFFYIYDDTKINLSDFFWTYILRNYKFINKYTEFVQRICPCNDVDFENKLVANKELLDGMRMELDTKIRDKTNEIQEYYKTYFAERVEFVSYDNKVQKIIAEGSNGNKA